MTAVKVGRWGASLAVRIPAELAEATGVDAGEDVELEIRDGDIVIRRSAAQRNARAAARKAMAEMLAERGSHSLGGLSIRELIEEGRR